MQGHVFVPGAAGDEHAGGVGGGVAGHALQGAGDVDEPLHLVVPFIEPAQFLGDGQGLLQGHADFHGHQFGHRVGLLIRHIHHPAHIPHGGLGGHGAEGDDLGHVIRAIAPGHVFDDLAPAFEIEINIDIGHGDALRVQKAFEEQVVFQGIDAGDAQQVAHDGACAAAATGAHQNAMLFGVIHIIPDDEEIIVEAHFPDNVQFVFQAGLHVLPGGVVPIGQAFPAELFQIGGGAFFPFGQGIFGQMPGGEIEFHMAALGDFIGAGDGVGEGGEFFQHFRLAFDVHFVRMHAHAVFIGEGFARLDTHEDFLGKGVLAGEIMAVVGDHQGNVHFPGQAYQRWEHLFFIRQGMVLQFDEEVIPAEKVQIPLGGGAGVFFPAVQQRPGNFPGEAGGQGDEAPAVLLQKLQIHPGAVIEAPGEAVAYQFDEVLIALLGFAQQHQVVIFPGGGGFIVHIRADVHLAADDRVNARVLHGPVKIHHAVHGPVIGNGAAFHAQFLDASGQLFDAAGPVQQGIFGMQMQMCKHGVRSLCKCPGKARFPGKNSAKGGDIPNDAHDVVLEILKGAAAADPVGNFKDFVDVLFRGGDGHHLDIGVGLLHQAGDHFPDAVGHFPLIGGIEFYAHKSGIAGDGDPGFRNLGELVDGLLHLLGLGLPVEGLAAGFIHAAGDAGGLRGDGGPGGGSGGGFRLVAGVHAAGKGQGQAQGQKQRCKFAYEHESHSSLRLYCAQSEAIYP